MTDTRLLRRNIVELRTGLARSTIYSKMKTGVFPLPIRIGPRSVRWREADIDAFVENPGGWGIHQASRRAFGDVPDLKEEKC